MPAATSIILGGGALLGAGGGLAGALIQKGAQEDATAAQLTGQREAISAQTQAQREAIAAQMEAQRQALAAQREGTDKSLGIFQKYADQARSDLAPIRESELAARRRLEGMINPDEDLFAKEKDLASQEIMRTLAAQGLLRSKKQVDLLSGLETNFARQKRDYTLNILGALSGTGATQATAQNALNTGSSLAGLQQQLGANLGSTFQNAGANLSGIYQNTGGSLANLAALMGQTRGQGFLGGAQAISGGLAGLNNAFQGAAGNYMQLETLDRIFGKKNASGPPAGNLALLSEMYMPNGKNWGGLA